MSRPRVITGAHVLVHVNGALLGVAQDFSFTSDEPKKEIRGLDSLQAFELAPTGTACRGQLSVVRTIGDGGAEGRGLTTRAETVARARYFTLTLTERGSDTLLFQAQHCSVLSQTWRAGIKATVTGTISWQALSWSNEVRPASTT